MDIGGKPAEVEVFLAGLDPKGVGAALDIGGKRGVAVCVDFAHVRVCVRHCVCHTRRTRDTVYV